MTPQHNVVLRGGVADGQTLDWPDDGTVIEWEDTGGGAVTYVGTADTEDVNGSRLVVYRVAT